MANENKTTPAEMAKASDAVAVWANTPTQRVGVIRTDKHSQAITRMTFAEGVNDLAALMPASIYGSRMEVAADLMRKGHIETLGYLYEIAS